MTRIIPQHGLTLAAVVLLAGCSYDLKYNPAYLAAARRPATTQVDGKALIYTTAQDDAYSFSGHPASFTGSGTTAKLPLGMIVREAARAAFADVFRGGADEGASLDAAQGYRVIVRPRPTQFTHEYNQLRNLGFAITPIVRLDVDVLVVDATGSTIWQRSYQSGEVTAASYMINLSPEEEIDKAAHKAAYDLMARAAADIAHDVVQKTTAGGIPVSLNAAPDTRMVN